MSKRRIPVTASIVAAIAATTCSCNSQSTGSPQSTSSGTHSNGASVRSTENTHATASTTLADMNPCNIPTTEQLQSLGFNGKGEPDTTGLAQTCEWLTNNNLLSITVRANGGLDVLNENNGPLQDTIVGQHKAVKQKTSVSCTYFIGITASSRVGVQVSNDGQPDCDTAENAAKLIEPKLPKS